MKSQIGKVPKKICDILYIQSMEASVKIGSIIVVCWDASACWDHIESTSGDTAKLNSMYNCLIWLVEPIYS